jgi:hypothetical protein
LTKTEKFLLGTLIVSGIGLEIAQRQTSYAAYLVLPFILIFFVTNWTLLGYYLVKSKLSIFTLVISVWFIQWIGSIFKILHLSGADEMLWFGNFAHIIFALTIFWIAKSMNPKPDIFYYVIAGAILVQSILLITGIEQLKYNGELLNYLIVGSIGTVKIKNVSIRQEVDRLLNIYLITSILFIVHQLATNA